MDKENLFYVVRRGTNNRDITQLKEAWIGDKQAAEANVKSMSGITHNEWVIMSIKDYEKTFMIT